jgi:ATP-dependent helicase HrpB
VTEGGALAESLRGALVYPLDRQLNVLAPEMLEAPSGSHIRIEYGLPASDGAPPPAPVLAVRLQELFGMLETPRIVGGRVPLLLHLLSPGYKPIQITQDLRSFWSSAYFEVRKDLRTRYPKHKWPEDPLTAVPEAKGRSHRR